MAKSVKAFITPEVLKAVRERRLKLKIELAADKLNVETGQLRAWENGHGYPTFVQLKKIAKVYRTDISVFYLPEPPDGIEHPVDRRRFPHSITLDPEQTYRLNVNILEAHERRERLIELYELLEESPPEVTLKLNEVEGTEITAKKIKDFLQFDEKQLREESKPYAALKFWKQTIETKGILVCQASVHSHLSIKLETVRGFSVAHQPLPVIVINSQDSPYGRIFTIMHELVHIGLRESVMQNTGFRGTRPADDPTEVFCNEVAGKVLVPDHELKEKLNMPTLDADLPEMSKYFSVSREVIMRRLLDLGHISKKRYEDFRNHLLELNKHRSQPSGAPPYSTRLINAAGVLFAQTAFKAYYEQKITLADLSAAFSKCDTKHLPKIESVIFAYDITA